MYDKRELLCNLQVLHAPWVIGNFTVRLCRTKSTGLPLPNFFLGKEQMGRSISAGLLKKPGRGCSPLQHSRISIGYWVFQTITLQGFLATSFLQPVVCTCDCHRYFPALKAEQATQSLTDTQVVITWGYPQRHNLPAAKTRAGQGLPCQQPPAISKSTTQCRQYSLHTPCIHFTPFPFLIQNTALLYIQFIKAQSILQHTLLLLSAKLHPSYISSAYFPWAHFNWH